MASHQSILEYVKKNDHIGLSTYLSSRHVNIDENSREGHSCLHIAAEKGYVESLAVLLDNGANINVEDFDKCTPLHYASRNGHKKVVNELLERGGFIDILDSGHWTSLIWACYEGHVSVVDTLIARGADIHANGLYHITGLNWAAGRGHYDIVKLLLENKAKVDVGDKYGTTALIWASRNGYSDIVQLLLLHGASVNVVGMYSWTPLIVAVEKNHVSIVDMILDKQPNVNNVNKDGFTSLAIASKHGYTEIALRLCSKGAYINLADKVGDSNLIHAAKGGHRAIVECLLKKYADVNFKGRDSKTCLHWAIDKNHTEIVKMILNSNPDLEIRTIEGDTPLLRAVRNRNAEVIELLLDKKAKLSVTDNKGDTALHIGMRARSKALIEILLRNPKNSHLLYRRNKIGETPYSIDLNSQGTILGQVFGARRLNTNEDSENILGYDIYSSSLADILTEPSLSMPITIGLYAKWGSGKSFLINKLRDEMKNFIRHWINPSFYSSPILFLLILHMSSLIGVSALVSTFTTSRLGAYSGYIALGSFLFIFMMSYLFVIIIHQGSHKFNWMPINIMLAKKLNSLKLILQIMFCHPPGPLHKSSNSNIPPLRLLFTDQTKVGTSSGGYNSVTQMIGSLYDSIEIQYGKLSTRLFRAFRPRNRKLESSQRWRNFCCIPYVYLYMTVYIFVLCLIILFVIYLNYTPIIVQQHTMNSSNVHTILGTTDLSLDKTMIVEKDLIFGLLITLLIIVCTVIIANIYTICRIIKAVSFSQRQHLLHCVSKRSDLPSEGLFQTLKDEVTLLLEMVKCLDAFTEQQSRMVVIIDGLDSCEQDKVLSVLDAVQMLFSDIGSPFIIILAIDPHVITKAIELNLNQAFSDTSIGGNAYLRNIVHLPFFLQNTGLRKIKIAQQMSLEYHHEEVMRRSSMSEKHKKSRFKYSESLSSSIGSQINKMNTNLGEHPQDLTKMLLTDDYFNDVNPRSLRRLMNVIYVMGRLLKAFRIDFNWYHLSLWVNITEQWPYRTSWIIYFSEEHDWDEADSSTSLLTIYNKIKNVIPTQKDVEPLVEMDRDEKKMESFMTLHKKDLTLRDVKMFLPFSINLDPYIRKIIREELQNMEEMGIDINQLLTSKNSNHFSNPQGYTRRQVAELNKKHSYSDMLSLHNPKLAKPYVSPLFNTSFDSPLTHQFSKAENTSSDFINFPMELIEQRIALKSVKEVCYFLREIPGLTPSKLEDYCSTIQSENLIGSVLLSCDLNDLKKVLNMNFGDWELFRQILKRLRQSEKNLSKISVNLSPIPHKKVTKKYKKSLEKQLTMEEAMISGLLSTLNEEANQDIQDLQRLKDLSSPEIKEDMEVLYISHASPSSLSINETDIERGGSSRYSSLSRIAIGSHQSLTFEHFSPEEPGNLRRRKHISECSPPSSDPYAWLSQTAPPTPKNKRKMTPGSDSKTVVSFTDSTDDDDDDENRLSPEQETVLAANRPTSRGPHIQQLFSQENLLTAILPDGQPLKMKNDDKLI